MNGAQLNARTAVMTEEMAAATDHRLTHQSPCHQLPLNLRLKLHLTVAIAHVLHVIIPKSEAESFD